MSSATSRSDTAARSSSNPGSASASRSARTAGIRPGRWPGKPSTGSSCWSTSTARHTEGKRGPREEMVRGRAVDYGAYVAYVNAVGGQDELVFDGNSVI